MKYRYAEFTDQTGTTCKRKNGSLWYVGKPSDILIDDLGLEVVRRSGTDSIIGYRTTLEELGERGWELQFVTPCGANFANIDRISGPIENSYIFRKSE